VVVEPVAAALDADRQPSAIELPRRWRPSFADAYRDWQRLRTRAFSALLRGSFGSFAASARIQYPLRLDGERRIGIGENVFIASHCWLATYEADGRAGELEIGDGTRISGYCVLAAAARVTLGRSVLLARNVYIADHRHAYADTAHPVLAQGFAGVAPVEICDGAWLGQNVVVGPGVRIGRGAVIGANSFVREDVEDHCVAVGSPARIVRRFGQ
jgi:acetyltransferase-like isoleucine patch superfamily enzyme